MPHRIVLSAIEPFVRHGVWEHAQGAPVAHVLREIGAMSFLAGQGVPTMEAFRRVEDWERRGFFPEALPLARRRFEASEMIHGGAIQVPPLPPPPGTM